jgi:PAS domain S-box-containing protein
VREFKKKQVELFFNDRVRDVQILVNLLQTTGTEGYVGIDRIQQLVNIMMKSGYYSVIVLKDSTKYGDEVRVRSTSGEVSEHFKKSLIQGKLELLMNKKKHLHILDYQTLGTTSTLFITAPVISREGAVVGYVSAGLPSSTINRLIFENTAFSGLGFTGESYIVGNDLLMRSSSRFFENSIMVKRVRTGASLQVFNQGKGTIITMDYRNIEVVSSFTMLDIQDLRWALLAEIDMSEIQVPAVAIRNQMLSFISVVCIVLMIISFFISYRITVPLTRLLKATADIGEGKYGAMLPVTSTDEIGELTQGFNTMTTQIMERSRELKLSEKRLNRFYQATKDGIVIHDNVELLMVNNAMAQLTGYTMEEIMKCSLDDLLDIDDYRERVLNEDTTCSFETKCFRQDGTSFPVEVSKRAIEYDGVRVSSTIVHDITERVESRTLLEKERQKQLSSFIDGQENERKRVSRELHDGLGQSLIAIKMRLESIEPDDEKMQKAVEITKSLVNNTIDDVRRMSNNLMPSVLVEFGITTAISNLVMQMSSTTPISITFDHGKVPKDLDSKIQLYVFRIVQEALNNAVKHSGASQIQVMLLCEGKSLLLIIEDDGRGFDENHESKLKGNGLYHMNERVQLVNGSLEFSSETGKGLTIHVKIPL